MTDNVNADTLEAATGTDAAQEQALEQETANLEAKEEALEKEVQELTSEAGTEDPAPADVDTAPPADSEAQAADPVTV